MARLGKVLLDPEDEHLLDAYAWYLSEGYVVASVYPRDANGKPKTKRVSIHRLVMKAQKGQTVDHINGDKLDNRKENLRFCTQAQNCQNNRNVRKNKTSKYKGVSKRGSSWRAQIQLGKHKISVGHFKSELEAAIAYDNKAIELFREYASLNFKIEGYIMPIYTYHCNACGNDFDELVRKSDDVPSFCKYCASCQIERTVTAHGGYAMDSGPASVRPKGAGSFKKGSSNG